MRIAIGSDHAGFDLKEKLKSSLSEHHIDDFGTFSIESVDYPDFAKKVSLAVENGEDEMGILICGSGIGMSITANRYPGVRAALCTTLYHAQMARKHNDANVLAMGARTTHLPDAMAITDIFLKTPFEGGRHKRRVDKMSK